MVQYICPKCNKVFNKKSNFQYHVYKRKHSCVAKLSLKLSLKLSKNDNDFSCSRCDKSYKFKSGLSRHISTFHNDTLKSNKNGNLNNQSLDDINVEFYPSKNNTNDNTAFNNSRAIGKPKN